MTGRAALIASGGAVRVSERNPVAGQWQDSNLRKPKVRGRKTAPYPLSSRIIWSALWRRDLRQVAIGGFFCYQRPMNTVIDLFGSLWKAVGWVGELLGYLLRFVSVFFRTRAWLAARLLAAESQLGMCKQRIEQKQHPKPRFSRGFRILWVVLAKLWVPWQAATHLMQPVTVKAWHIRT